MAPTDEAVMYLLIGWLLGWGLSKLLRNGAPRMRRVKPRRPMAMYVDRAPDDRCKRNGPEAAPNLD